MSRSVPSAARYSAPRSGGRAAASMLHPNRGSARYVQAGTAARYTLSGAQRSGRLCVRHALPPWLWFVPGTGLDSGHRLPTVYTRSILCSTLLSDLLLSYLLTLLGVVLLNALHGPIRAARAAQAASGSQLTCHPWKGVAAFRGRKRPWPPHPPSWVRARRSPARFGTLSAIPSGPRSGVRPPAVPLGRPQHHITPAGGAASSFNEARRPPSNPPRLPARLHPAPPSGIRGCPRTTQPPRRPYRPPHARSIPHRLPDPLRIRRHRLAAAAHPPACRHTWYACQADRRRAGPLAGHTPAARSAVLTNSPTLPAVAQYRIRRAAAPVGRRAAAPVGRRHAAPRPATGAQNRQFSGHRRRSRRRRASVSALGFVGGPYRAVDALQPSLRLYCVDRAGHALGGSGGRVLGGPRAAPGRGLSDPSPAPVRTR